MNKSTEEHDFAVNGVLNLEVIMNEEMDADIVARIRPLDPAVEPSLQFRLEMRERLMALGPKSSRRAA